MFMDKNLSISIKIKNELTLWPSNLSSGSLHVQNETVGGTCRIMEKRGQILTPNHWWNRTKLSKRAILEF